MALSRRNLIKYAGGVAGLIAGRRLLGDFVSLPTVPGPFQGNRASLSNYQVPDWFRRAKFGIWSHWGPQSAIAAGGWYARDMYREGSEPYKYQLKTYGHPSKLGYKDLVDIWTADRWDPDHLMQLYKKAGARYFVSMGVHHDNFDLWPSKYQPRWNAVTHGPHRDVVGDWQKAAQKHNLRFGVTEHLWISYKWLAVSHGADKLGPLAGVPYDGNDPRFADLYHDANVRQFVDEALAFTDDDITDAWKQHWFNRVNDLVRTYKPDFLYSDGHLPFEEYGLATAANLYNLSAQAHGGNVEAVYTVKRIEDTMHGVATLDRERGVPDEIWPNPWQTDTCIGNWFYNKLDPTYKTAKAVIDILVDVVSKNGNLLLNFPLPASGELDSEEMKILDTITGWMAVNGEALYDSVPWKIYGYGPSTKIVAAGKRFNENARPALTADDVRFTRKGSDLYVFVMGTPGSSLSIAPLGTSSAHQPGIIAQVELLGFSGNLNFQQTGSALTVTLPSGPLSPISSTFKVTFA